MRFLRVVLLSIGFALVLESAGLAVERQLDCGTSEGREVCVAIRRVESVAQPCAGGGCDFLRMAQLMDRATDLYIESLAESATDQVGRIARDASSDLCSLEIEGPSNVILRFVSSANRFLEAMLELQEIALVTSPDTCHFEISGS